MEGMGHLQSMIMLIPTLRKWPKMMKALWGGCRRKLDDFIIHGKPLTNKRDIRLIPITEYSKRHNKLFHFFSFCTVKSAINPLSGQILRPRAISLPLPSP